MPLRSPAAADGADRKKPPVRALMCVSSNSLSKGALVLAPLPVVAGLPVLHSGTAPQAGRLDKIRPVWPVALSTAIWYFSGDVYASFA